ncbi:MAG: hypothetical protein QOJ27_1486 [Sphingomonadales bacterium]|nr:hypothetical protein [Sphingomonadales bacterium]
MLLTRLEQDLLSFATRGTGILLGALAHQVGHLQVSSRTVTPAGFFTNLHPLDESLRIEARNFQISDIEGTAAELEHGFGLLVFVRSGQIDMIEVFTYEERWPGEISSIKLNYSGSSDRSFDRFKM